MEEELIQLTLTPDEALILSSVTAFGIKTALGDLEGAKVTQALLFRAIIMCPRAAETLTKKMITLSKTITDQARKELENETKMEDNRIQEV